MNLKYASRDIAFVCLRRNGKERLQRRQWWSSCVPGRRWKVVPGGTWIEKIKQLIFSQEYHQHCPFVIKAGIVSFGPSPCDTHIPSVFTRVAGFRLFQFLKTTTFDQALVALPDSKFLIYSVTFLFAGTG